MSNPTKIRRYVIDRPEAGNALIYVLIALALIGYLTMSLSRQNSQNENQDISKEQIELYASELIEYAASAQQVIDRMEDSGTKIGYLDFVNPTSAVFDTPPHITKIFHPLGGGLVYQPMFNSAVQNDPSSAWVMNRTTNVEWTPSNDPDLILTAYFITRPVCEALNKKIIGQTTIPATTNPHADYFLDGGTQDLTSVECAGCEGYPTLCVENDTGDNYSFYSVIGAQ